MRYINLVGQKINKLTILEFSHTDKFRKACWKCKCECGKFKVVSTNDLKSNHVKSCGCLHKYKQGESGLLHLYRTYRIGAKRRGYIFDLTLEDFKTLTKDNCSYCNKLPSNIRKQKTKHSEYTYNGIDRLNNDIGYIKENCITSCGECNRMKGELSYQEFKNHINNIHRNINVLK